MVKFLANYPNVFCTLRTSAGRSNSSLRLQKGLPGGCLDHVVESSKNPGCSGSSSMSFLAKGIQTDYPNLTKSPQIFRLAY